MTAEKAIERSLDTLQRLYAVIAALAMNEALKRTFLQGGAGEIELDVGRMPEFLAFIVTVVPFIHGMNRSLDHTLKTIKITGRRWLLVVLVFDFVVFLAETCLLFLLATTVKAQTDFFWLLTGFLTVDIVWSLITSLITGSAVWRWAAVNVIAIVLIVACLRWIPFPNRESQLWTLMALAIGRTFFDYLVAWDFYFPRDDGVAAIPVTRV
jgi:hypothetical protein